MDRCAPGQTGRVALVGCSDAAEKQNQPKHPQILILTRERQAAELLLTPVVSDSLIIKSKNHL